MPLPISDQTTNRLVNAVDTICQYVETGMSPNEAAIKVANDFGLSQPQVELIARGYNAGAITAQRKADGAVEDKFASVPLVDAAVVTKAVFPTDVSPSIKLSVDSLYSRPYTKPTSKVAEINTRDQAPTPFYKKMAACDCGCGSIGSCKGNPAKDQMKRREMAKEKLASLQAFRRKCDELEMSLATQVAELSHKCAMSYGPSALAYFKKYACSINKPIGEMLFNDIAASSLNSLDKAAFDNQFSSVKQPEPLNSYTHILIGNVIDTFEKWAQHEAALPAVTLLLRRDMDKLSGAVAKPDDVTLLPPGIETQDDLFDQEIEKMAISFGDIAGASLLTQSLTGKSPDKPADDNSGQVRETILKLNDPNHQAKLQALKVQAMLNEMMSSDDIVSSYKPQEVATAFNELSRSAPSMLKNMALLRANLRRSLQGNLSPFEAKEIVMADRLQRGQAPPSGMMM